MSEYRGIEVFGRQPRRRAEPPVRRRSRLALLGLAAALVTAASTIAGISLALAGSYELSILLAYLGTGTSVVAFLCGVAAILTGRGRALGVVALFVGVLSSPPVLTKLLDWASGLG